MSQGQQIDLSVVIVNYNVKYFLEQCLLSCQLASKNGNIEIFVVDNHSVDGSVDLVREKFPDVHLIDNQVNVGFSKANNQAIRQSNGKYVLLLNPDTIVEEDTFEKVIAFMDEHPDAGGLGVKMIDGKGEFLPESKRAFPSPLVAFYKMFGLTALFPTSKRFSHYHLGYLSNDEIHEIEVLSGAFMLLRKEVLDEIGLLDETFFMYGEDIDLSYRIVKAGYKNYYFPDTRIIHYKGESTKKGSINYVLVFYKAMIIFAKKHLSQKNVRTFTLMINAAIYLRAFLAIIHRFLTRTLLPLADGIGIVLGLIFLPQLLHGAEMSTNQVFNPLYAIIWLLFLYITGAYDRPFKLINLVKGTVIGTPIVIGAHLVWGQADTQTSISLLASAGWGAIWTASCRLILNAINPTVFKLAGRDPKRYLIVGKEGETSRIVELLKRSMVKTDFLAFLNPGQVKNPSPRYIGTIGQLTEAIGVFRINEIIFSASDVAPREIITNMANLNNPAVDIKIAPPSGKYIIGSHSVIGEENVYRLDENRIDLPKNQRVKMLVDLLISTSLLLLFPAVLILVRRPLIWMKNALRVIWGNVSWVGPGDSLAHKMNFPKLKRGIFYPPQVGRDLNDSLSIYWRNYIPSLDLGVVWSHLKQSMRF